MTIRFPDLQVVLPRSVELSNTQQQRIQRPITHQQQVANLVEGKKQLELQQVTKTLQGESKGINSRDGQNKQFSRRKKHNRSNKKKPEDNHDEKQGNSYCLGNNIDLKT